MTNTTWSSTEDLTNELQNLKRKTNLNFFKIISNYFNDMKYKKFQSEHNHFSKKAQGIAKIYYEVIFKMKLLQTKPQVENMNINYYDLFYTVIRIRFENKDIDNEYEDYDNYYFDIKDFITPHLYVGVR